jgi:hypothetical protein
MRAAKRPEVGAPPACEGELNMDPVEINAGQWYLRALRADNRIDDRPALADLGVTDPDYVARCTVQWSSDTSYSWAVCEPTTGELLAEVTLDVETGEIAARACAGQARAASAAAESVRRFAAALNGVS